MGIERKNKSKYVKFKVVKSKFDLAALQNSGMEFAYDAMYGAGQNAMRRLFPDITFLHCEENLNIHRI